MAPVPKLEPLPPAEALDFFRSKGLQESFAWEDVEAQEHAKAFTVAKAMRRDILYDIREALDRAISEGKTFEQFKAELRPLLESKGWWGRKTMVDPLDGQEKNVQLGSSRRLRTIFDVNLRSAFQAGRWQRIQGSKALLPYLRYVAVQDSRTRPEHRAWHGTVLPVDDAWWGSHYPPCGWNCRCTVVQLNKRTLDRRNWPITDKPPQFPPRTYTNSRTGEVSVMEQGIDPGFGYNVGQSWLGGVTPRASRTAPSIVPDAKPKAPPALPFPRAQYAPPAQLDAELARKAVYGTFGLADGAEGVFTDVAGEDFPVGPKLFLSPSGAALQLTKRQLGRLPLAALAIRHPDEIRWVWLEGEPRQLVRRYIARVQTPAGLVSVVVDTSAGGGAPFWRVVTSEGGALDLDSYRTGDLAWSRKDS